MMTNILMLKLVKSVLDVAAITRVNTLPVNQLDTAVATRTMIGFRHLALQEFEAMQLPVAVCVRALNF